jgi:hypothetical protein
MREAAELGVVFDRQQLLASGLCSASSSTATTQLEMIRMACDDDLATSPDAVSAVTKSSKLYAPLELLPFQRAVFDETGYCTGHTWM